MRFEVPFTIEGTIEVEVDKDENPNLIDVQDVARDKVRAEIALSNDYVQVRSPRPLDSESMDFVHNG